MVEHAVPRAAGTPPAVPMRTVDEEPSWWWRLHPVGRARLLAGFVLAVAGPGAMAGLLALQPGLGGLPTQTLLMLTVTVTTALVGGLLPAVASSLLGGVLLNVVFVEPVGRLAIADPRQAVAIGLFLLIGVAVALVVDLAARQAERTRRARAEADALADLARRLLVTGSDLTGLLAETGRFFGRTSVAVWRTGADGSFSLESSWGEPHEPTAPGSVRAGIDRDAALVLPGPALPPAGQALLTAYAAHLRVIRDRTRADRQAVDAAALEQGSRTRSALLAAVSHDLRTPLAAIKAASGSLRSTDVAWSDQDRDELLGTVEEAADQMGSLVGNLLDMTRLDTGAVAVLIADVDLDGVVDAAVRPLSGHARVQVVVPDDLPPALADAGLLERVVANLVENALRHTVGEVLVRAALRTEDDGRGDLLLDVVDHGRGVAREDRVLLFRPFRRLGDTPQGEGLGLGLAVAHGLTEAMGGTLEPADTPGGGLTMRLRLPAAHGSP